MENQQNRAESAILSTGLYYRLLDRPLTNVELFRYLCPADKMTFSRFLQTLQNQRIASRIRQFQGFYFFNGDDCASGFRIRQKRAKISQMKWKKTRQMVSLLQIAPFLKMIGVTGSLSLENASEESDIDLLIALEPGRLWISRTFITLLLNIAGWRRHGKKTKDRACLNCYLAGQDMEIKIEIKPRSLHSAQEYSRLIPVWQKDESAFARFKKENAWIGEYLENHPWPNRLNFKTAEKSAIAGAIRKTMEFLLSGLAGDCLEKALAKWQSQRIRKKMAEAPDPADQIYFSNQYLMFHPHSKSAAIMQEHEKLLKESFA